MTRRILLTGAAGRVAHQLLPGLDEHELRLLDRSEPPPHGDAQLLVGELTDRDLLARAVEGIDTVVHLAGDPSPSATWDELRGPNVDGFAALLGAAAEHGVRRVVYASSVHAMGRYESDGALPVQAHWAPAPCCPYGATKAFDEAVAGVFADRRGLSTIGLRLGATTPVPEQRSQLSSWLGPEDLRRLVRGAVETEVPFGVYPATSANTRGHWDLGPARADLGYEPTLDSAAHAGEVEDDGTDVTTCRRP
ncbi:NAD-dependent epimerase/dehydratase family protein [Kineococcus sp. T13]|uniref:NAD-dependent epimerase/dehydratase family protein n=1 Tax=Kineococcus vitellinus TaxID=2696565 RepID=UPI001412D595|nr:NAD-dependent epimerase/dehydratase family protein [Kineococcus vitellinus]